MWNFFLADINLFNGHFHLTASIFCHQNKENVLESLKQPRLWMVTLQTLTEFIFLVKTGRPSVSVKNAIFSVFVQTRWVINRRITAAALNL